MKVILLQDVKSIGKQSQVLEVKTGYANNYLIPKKLAVVANDKNMQELERQLAEKRALEAKIKQEALDLKAKLNSKVVKLFANGGTEGRLYGAITSIDVAGAIKNEYAEEIDKRKIAMDNIKSVGSYNIKIKLHPEVDCEMVVSVTIK